MAQSHIGPSEPVGQPAELDASIPFPPVEAELERRGLDFEASRRRHPAETRVNRLFAEIPARFIAFDILVWNSFEASHEPLTKRRMCPPGPAHVKLIPSLVRSLPHRVANRSVILGNDWVLPYDRGY